MAAVSDSLPYTSFCPIQKQTQGDTVHVDIAESLKINPNVNGKGFSHNMRNMTTPI